MTLSFQRERVRERKERSHKDWGKTFSVEFRNEDSGRRGFTGDGRMQAVNAGERAGILGMKI